jgi:hypothetical protein
MTDYYH